MRLFLILACAALFHAPATAATSALGWQALETQLLHPVAQDDQLPNSAIPTALATDGQGFLWVGTQNGLARWDGLRFRIYNPEARPGALPDSQVETLHIDARGRLWIGTVSAGLARFDPAADRFITYPAGPGGLSHVGVLALADAPDGGLWVGTEAGLDLLAPATGRVRHMTAAPGQAAIRAALASGVAALAVSQADQALWIGTREGLLRRDGRTGAFSRVRLGASGAPMAINALMLASDGRLWIGTEGRGAYVLRPATQVAAPVPGTMRSGARAAAGMRVRTLLELSPDEIWLGAYDDGVLAVDPATLASRRIHLGAANVLYGDQNVRILHRDPSGLVFIAANGAITRYDPRWAAFSSVLGGKAPTAVLTQPVCMSLFLAPDHRIWVGFPSHGLDVIDPRTGRVTHVEPGVGGLPNGAIRDYVAAPDGRVLVATDGGLYRTDLDGRHVQRLAQPGRAPDARVQALLRDGRRLWLAGRDGLWAYRLGPGDVLAPEITVPADQLTDRRLDVVALDPRGGLWIGADNGLNHYDPATRRVERMIPRPGDETSPRGFISGVTYDSRGWMWVATFGRGVSVARPAAPGQLLRFRRVDLAQGLPNANVNKVLEDEQGFIWVSTDSGLARIDPATLRARAFKAPEGVPISSFFYNAGLRTPDGRLMFAGLGGLELVRPGRLTPMRSHAPLVVTEVRVRGALLPGDPFLKATKASPLRVPSGAGGFLVGFAALDYAAPERVRYAYRLAGYSDAWIETDASRRVAAFTNLPPGRYRLEIRAVDPTGVWTPQVLSLPIRVMPTWSQTWWFHLLQVLIGCALVALLIRWRTDRLQRHRAELEKLVAERTQVLENQAVELAQARVRAEASAKAKSDFLANMSHEIRTPLNGVVAVADMLARAGLGPKERQMAEIIRASGDTLQRLLSDILDMARIESGKIAIEQAPFQVGDMVRAVAGLYQLRCDEKGVRLALEIAPEIDQVVVGDLVRVRQVLSNLLSNAVKFTERGEVRLTAERTGEGRARFTVRDTGVGFDMADKAKVLGRFEQADSSITRRFGGTGLGLSICCDLAGLMGGALDCESAPGAGSRFWIELPLEPAGAEAVVDSRGAASAADGEGQPLRILVADDHPTNRKVIELMLEGGHAELTMAEDGAQAVEAFRSQVFDLVLMDMQMPGMDGLTAIALIRQAELAGDLARTPIVMLTANALPDHVAAALAAGADLHMAKPFTAAALFDCVDAALALRGQDELAA